MMVASVVDSCQHLKAVSAFAHIRGGTHTWTELGSWAHTMCPHTMTCPHCNVAGSVRYGEAELEWMRQAVVAAGISQKP